MASLLDPLTTSFHSDDHSQSTATDKNPQRVELATLVLPSQAWQEGLEAGEGAQVVLEAQPETVETLASEMAEVQSQSQSQTPDVQMQSQISAVVDLEILSELVGVSEEEFIADLHAHKEEEAKEQPQEEPEKQAEEMEAKDGKAAASADEETPLLSTTTTTTSDTTTTTTITLPADPFIETLADVLPTTTTTIHELPTIDEKLPFKEEDEELPLVQDTPATLPPEPGVTEATATKTEDDQHLGHDAFLLNIPNEDSDGDIHDHFVLALPEIRLEEPSSRLSDTSTLSHQQQQHHNFPLLEKALSLLPTDFELPSDVQSIHLEAHKLTPEEQEELMSKKGGESIVAPAGGAAAPLHLDLVVEHKVPIIGYIILFGGLIALASVGAALDLQHGPSPLMKTIWRQLATSLVLLPLVIQSVCFAGGSHDKANKEKEGGSIKKLQFDFSQLTKFQWLQLPLCAIAYSYMTLAFVVALDMTTMANAFVLSNMTSLVIIAGRAAMGLPVLLAEGWGAVIGFLGAAICANDASRTLAAAAAAQALTISTDIDDIIVSSSEEDTTTSTTTITGSPMLGNIIAFSASFGTAFYLTVAKNLRSSMDLFVFMFCVMFLGALFLMVYLAVASGEDYSFDLHPDHGIFGWLRVGSFDRLPLELYMAIICNCFGTTGYVAVLKYFEPVVPAVVMLLEPVVGALLGVAAGTAKMPGLQTWVGDVVVAAGTYCVIWAGASKTEKIDATIALRPPGEDDDDDDASTIVTLLSRHSKQSKATSTNAQDLPAAKVVWDLQNQKE